MCELSGHIILPNDSDYEDLSEQFLIEIAKDAKLDLAKLDTIKNDIQKIF